VEAVGVGTGVEPSPSGVVDADVFPTESELGVVPDTSTGLDTSPSPDPLLDGNGIPKEPRGRRVPNALPGVNESPELLLVGAGLPERLGFGRVKNSAALNARLLVVVDLIKPLPVIVAADDPESVGVAASVGLAGVDPKASKSKPNPPKTLVEGRTAIGGIPKYKAPSTFGSSPVSIP
jgi:hypothetical protein